jgi:hypothetical protein
MRKIILVYTCFLLLLASHSQAQPVGGTLSGKVTSVAGAAIPNATVTVTNTSTNASQKLLTGSDGTFSISGLAPGTYRVDVETNGYQRTSQENVELTTTGPATVNITLQPGDNTQVVAATGTTSQVQSESGEISTDLGTRQVRELPVEDRNYQQLAGTDTGITPPTPAFNLGTDPARNRFFSVNGQDPTTNINELDGLSNLEPFRGTAIRVVPDETIAQMNITTSDFSENKGFAGGGVLNEITRTGTNDLHGSLFEFNSGDWLQSRNFFDTAGVPKPRYVFNQFGGTIGGPIVKNRTFIFGSYEGTFQNGGTTQLTTVPTSAAVMGDFSGIPGLTVYNPYTFAAGSVGRTIFPGNIIPTADLNPTAQAIAGFLPSPNLPGYYDNYVSNVPFKDNGSKVDGRIDQKFTDTTSAFLRWGYTNFGDYAASPLGSVIGAGTENRLVAQNVIADVTHVFGPAMTTEFDFGYNRYVQRQALYANQAPLGNVLGVGLNNDLVGIQIAGLDPIGSPAYLPEQPVDNTFDWAWTWSLHHSMHNLQWGADVRRFRNDGFTDTAFGSLFGPNGTAYFGPGATLANGGTLSPYGELYNSLAAFLVGAPSQIGISNYLVPPDIRQTVYGLWVGDTLHLLNRVTVDLGARYEIYSPLVANRAGGEAFLNPTDDTFNYAGIGGVPLHQNLYNLGDIAPRIGIAVRVTDKTVVRGGYGMHYFEEPYMLSGFMAPVAGTVAGIQGGYTTAPLTAPFGPTYANPVPLTFPVVNGTSADDLPATVIPRHLAQPYAETFSLGIQQSFYLGTMLGVAYVGALGRQLPYIEELNAALPGTGVAGLPYEDSGRTASTLFYGSGLTSNYNSLQVNLNKRYAKEGLSFMGSYTYGKALGYTAANGFLLNPYDLRANYGPLDWDRQSVLSISHLWDLPFGRHGSSLMSTLLGGWQLNGIFSWVTGTPLTATADPITCDCPNATVLASQNPGVSPYSAIGGAYYLNPAAFTAPDFGQFGNLSRGVLRGPGFTNYNMSLFKSFRVRDRYALELRAEVYNIANTPHFANPVMNVSAPDFGQSVSTLPGALGRQLNLGARLMF